MSRRSQNSQVLSEKICSELLQREAKDVNVLTAVCLDDIVPALKIKYLENLQKVCEQIRVTPLWYQIEPQTNKWKMLQIYQLSLMYAFNINQMCGDSSELLSAKIKQQQTKVKCLKQDIRFRKKQTNHWKKLIRKIRVEIEWRKTEIYKQRLQTLKQKVKQLKNADNYTESQILPTLPQQQFMYVPESSNNEFNPDNNKQFVPVSQNTLQSLNQPGYPFQTLMTLTASLSLSQPDENVPTSPENLPPSPSSSINVEGQSAIDDFKCRSNKERKKRECFKRPYLQIEILSDSNSNGYCSDKEEMSNLYKLSDLRKESQSQKPKENVRNYLQLHQGIFALLDSSTQQQSDFEITHTSFFGSLTQLTAQINRQKLQFPQLYHQKIHISDQFDDIEMLTGSTVARPSKAKYSVIKRNNIINRSAQAADKSVKEVHQHHSLETDEKAFKIDFKSEPKINSHSGRLSQRQILKQQLKAKIRRRSNSCELNNKNKHKFSASVTKNKNKGRIGRKSQEFKSCKMMPTHTQCIKALQQTVKQRKKVTVNNELLLTLYDFACKQPLKNYESTQTTSTYIDSSQPQSSHRAIEPKNQKSIWSFRLSQKINRLKLQQALSFGTDQQSNSQSILGQNTERSEKRGYLNDGNKVDF